jgi:hypothetical protein
MSWPLTATFRYSANGDNHTRGVWNEKACEGGQRLVLSAEVPGGHRVRRLGWQTIFPTSPWGTFSYFYGLSDAPSIAFGSGG